MTAWVMQELQTLQLSDSRLTRRTKTVLRALADNPAQSIPEACGNRGQTKAAYRLLSNKATSWEAILAAHWEQVPTRVLGEPVVLCIQDTTNIDFTGHTEPQELGYLDNMRQRGLKMHTTLCVNADGVPVGIIGQTIWTRPLHELGKRYQRRKRVQADKESQRWLTALTDAEKVAPSTVPMITIADREADIFALFVHPRRPGSELLIRISHNRRVDHECGHLREAIASQAVAGTHVVDVGRAKDRQPRKAVLSIRIGSFAVRSPHATTADKRAPMTVRVQVIMATEEQPPANVPPIQWVLLTTMPVTNLADAVVCLSYYAKRWLIERFHFTLKSGCGIENIQLTTIDGIRRILALYSIIAWRLLWITYQARRKPDSSCEVALEPHEWHTLYRAVHKTPHLPPKTPTINQAVRWIGMLGGFLGRTRDGDPGVKVLWRGWNTLEILVAFTLTQSNIQ